jgi:hypothetical protein
MQNGVHLHWGKLMTNGQIKLITPCVHNSPALELLRRAGQKISDGYIIQSNKTYLPK